jgi:hypothetical protein
MGFRVWPKLVRWMRKGGQEATPIVSPFMFPLINILIFVGCIFLLEDVYSDVLCSNIHYKGVQHSRYLSFDVVRMRTAK